MSVPRDFFSKSTWDGRLTGFLQSLIIESCLANLESRPLFAFELFIDVDNVERFVLEKVRLRRSRNDIADRA